MTYLLNEPTHDKTNKITCTPSEDSDQPSLIRVSAVRMKEPWVLSGFLHADSEDSDQTGWMPRLI